MSRVASNFILTAVAVTALSCAACSGGDIAVGRSDQQLQTRKNGQPTGNGTTCSWHDTTSYETATSDGATTSSADAQYDLGDEFPALDGCNECKCTTKGIMCTIRTCGGGGSTGNPGDDVICDADARICPDGSAVGRVAPSCEFEACPAGAGVDESKLGQACGPNFECPSGQQCASYPFHGNRCMADLCAPLTCAPSYECQILETFPAQVRCGR